MEGEQARSQDFAASGAPIFLLGHPPLLTVNLSCVSVSESAWIALLSWLPGLKIIIKRFIVGLLDNLFFRASVCFYVGLACACAPGHVLTCSDAQNVQ